MRSLPLLAFAFVALLLFPVAAGGVPGVPTLHVRKIGDGRVASVPPGIDCGLDCTETYAPDTLVELSATPGAGFGFTGWTGACAGASTCIVQMTSAKTVTAKFQRFPLRVLRHGGGTVTGPGISCGLDCQESYAAKSTVALTATAAPGSGFLGWSGACSGAGACQVAMTGAKRVTATFVSFKLTVKTLGSGSVTGPGISCKGDCTEGYAPGRIVALTANPAPGWMLSAWSGACTGAGDCAVTMAATRKLTAKFVRASSFPLAVKDTGTGTGTISSTDGTLDCSGECSHVYPVNAMVELEAAPAADSVFIGWSGACSGLATCVVKMDRVRSVSAQFMVPAPLAFREIVANPSAVDSGQSTAITITARMAAATVPDPSSVSLVRILADGSTLPTGTTFVAVSDVPDLAVDEVAARGTVTVTEDGPALIAFVLSAPGVGGAVQSPPFFLTIVALRPFEFARTAFADAVEQGDTDAVNEMLTRRLADAGALDGLSPDDRVALANAVRSCAVVEEIEVMKICTATTTIAGRTGELRFFFLQDGSGHWRILTW